MKILRLVTVLFFFLSCKKEVEKTEIKADTIQKVAVETPTDFHNSQTSLDWQGTYKGVTPCADCEGTETEITLNQDLTYKIKTKYLGKSDGKIFEEKGIFIWDKSGGKITLNGSTNRPYQYKVGENQLIQLDLEGNTISGNLANRYILKK